MDKKNAIASPKHKHLKFSRNSQLPRNELPQKASPQGRRRRKHSAVSYQPSALWHRLNVCGTGFDPVT
ncbi:MAG: hypothetical protein F6K63_13745 [Moorea sp. SIO1G6]|uniref:hypothetical protein n=1 Tax=Moorena sp. SIO1G6 TaxID=2607840 RepID=UPI0013C14AF6|nr:hypothetical protein [Moorena sp. SIO1G6]NES82862.1 hypothetical protein [Moorena sp. SIO2B7]NET65383.1 hypothetical protein [Moorena sp. SIO1G6]